MKKFISLLLALVMILSAFAACADNSDDKGNNDKDPGKTPSEDTASDSAESHTALDLPDSNYNGREFRVLGKGDSQAHWKSVDISADEVSSDPISNAVYYRNLAVEEKYGIKVVEYDVASYFDQSAEAMLSCAAGTDDYDMFCLSPVIAIASLINNGYLIDLETMPYMNLDAEWYDQNSIEQLSLDNKVFLATGSMLIMDDDATGAILFNKKLAAEYNMPSFYDMVEDGTWTIDKLTEYAGKAAFDVNSNSKLDVDTDVWGLLTENDTTIAFIAGAGEKIIDKDDSDYPYIACSNESYLNMLEKVLAVSNDFNVTMYAQALSGYGDVWVEALDVAFKEDRALFNAAWLQRATLFRSMETDFGILPYPKYDNDQKDYYSFVSLYCANSISVPITCTDTDFVSIAIEALSYESKYGKNSLDEAYYTKTLESKNARDEESQKMLDIIFSNTVFDLGYMFNWGSICGTITGMGGVSGGSAEGFTSKITSINKPVNKNIEKTMNKIFES